MTRAHRRPMLAALMLIAVLTAVDPAAAEPALWVVKGKAATVYLFGTMHVLPRKAVWLSQKIRAAFDRSDTLWEEADIEVSDPKAVQHLLGLGMAPDTDLFALLPPDYAASFRTQLTKCGLSAEMIQHFRPWFAAQVVPLQCALRQGNVTPLIQPGPETVFLHLAAQAKKTKQFFETADQQFDYLSSASPEGQLHQLEQAIDESTDVKRTEIAMMEAAWLAGDESGLMQQISKMQREDQQAYQTLLVERNENFTAKITDMLAGDGVTFVAIGVGHLIGADSVTEALKKQGFAPHRI